MRIGVLTGGGDAAGLNAAIRAVGRTALRQGDEVAGILNGWAGLLDDGELIELEESSFIGALREGGTMLGSSRTNPLAMEDGIDTVVRNLGRHQLDALVAIGGDDTLSVAARLAERGLPVVGLPKTVDYDLAVTEYCIGFETAVGIISEALDRLHTTAASHHRTMVCEVMGRDTGWLAVMGGIAGGADLIVIPEFEVEIDEPIEVSFLPADPKRPPSANIEDEPDELVDGRIDLGAIASEFLTLALDPYPRKPGVAFEGPALEAEKPSPFSRLRVLSDREEPD